MTNVVEMTGVVKRFGPVTALDGLDLAVAEGEVHGFLGPNGAGKTTTLRLLLGMLRSNAGSIQVLGLDPWRDVATLHRRLAYVPGDVALWPNLTGGEVIDLLGQLQGGQDQARRDRLLVMFDLDPTKKARTYSKGNRQKVALIAALATDAELFLLDEPTSGLDPLMEDSFRRCARELRDQGRTILLSSHILSEAEALSDRVSIIRAGKVAETGPLAQPQLRARTARPRAHHPAKQPHPVRGRGAVRPGQHHPRRQGGGDRPARAAAAPDPDLGHRRRRGRAAAPGAPARGPRRGRDEPPGRRPGRTVRSGPTHGGADRSRSAHADQPAPNPGGAVPAALQRS